MTEIVQFGKKMQAIYAVHKKPTLQINADGLKGKGWAKNIIQTLIKNNLEWLC